MLQARLNWLTRIFRERFGQDLYLSDYRGCVSLHFSGTTGSIIFANFEHAFKISCSDIPFTHWSSADEGWSSILGSPLPAPGALTLQKPLIEVNCDSYLIHYDIPGLTYWMLARVEEIGRFDLDKHERFPATASHAFMNHYLERPVVEEWFHLLEQVIQRQWPSVSLKQHCFFMQVSHDVDAPSRYAFAKPGQLTIRMLGDLKRREFGSFAIAPWIWFFSKQKLHRADPSNTFDWIMDLSEKHGLVSSFYFIGGRTHPPTDPQYALHQPLIRDILKHIHSRGHEIGLHPSYNTYLWPDRLKYEADQLKNVCHQEGIKQTDFGGRMHYLRWRCPDTLIAWERANLTYDATLTYADLPGFRCGTSREYPAFDPVNQNELSLRIRPLVVMEKTVIGKNYLGLGEGSAALNKFLKLKETCRAMKMPFTLLWHNTSLSPVEKRLYENVLDA